jgi:Ser/Thr protein kinase RdoA (MazF antagonist)
MLPITDQELCQIITQFELGGEPLRVTPISSGHINDTFASQVQTPTGERVYIHQRINHHVFHHPAQVMENIARVTAHIRAQVVARGGDPVRRTLQLVPVQGGGLTYTSSSGDTWRTYLKIEGAHTYEVPENPQQVYHAARAFGEFQYFLSSLPGQRLYETIPDFHNTPKRFATLLGLLKVDPCNRAALAQPEIDFILARQADTALAIDRMARGELPERVTHNDTKLNNVLIDDRTGEGICVLDLDTVMPGTVLYDFGDMVRAGTATAAEDEPDLDKVGIDLDLFRQLANGYTETARGFLTPLEWQLLPQAGKLITLEQGIRFLSDYLQGDTYYKTHRPAQNLDRARTQLKMVSEMERKLPEIEKMISDCHTG